MMRNDVVNLIGMPFGSHGLGRDLRDKAHGLLDIGVDIDIVEVNYSSLSHQERDARLEAHVTDEPRGDINLICLAGPMYRLALRDRAHLFEDRVNILQPFWEFSTLQPNLVADLNRSDEIWVPTKFLATAFRRYARPEVVQMPSGTELDRPSSRDFRRELGIAADDLMFLQTFHCNSLVARKDPEASILAFLDAFGGDTGAKVRLVLKYAWEDTPSLDRVQMDAFLTLARRDDRIVALDAALNGADMAALMHAADVYVSPHRCEGLGRGILEAMQIGKAVIATDYSGAADQIAPHIRPIPYSLVNVGLHAHGSISPGLEWAQADILALAKTFAEFESDRAIVWTLGLAAADAAPAITGRRTFAKAAMTRVDEIRKSPAGRASRFRIASGERQSAETLPAIRADHRFRYAWAIEGIRAHFAGRQIDRGADFLCGTGYGATMLRALAPVYAFDASAEAIALARRAFAGDGIDYTVASFPGVVPPGPFDFVVALEAVEHVEDHRGFIEMISGSLSEGGVAVMSTPDQDHLPWHPIRNKFHIRHFTPKEMVDICAEFGLRCVGFAGQAVYTSDRSGHPLPDSDDMIPVDGRRDQFSLFMLEKMKREPGQEVPVEPDPVAPPGAPDRGLLGRMAEAAGRM